MPRANYILLKYTLFLCNIILLCSLILFASLSNASDTLEQTNWAYFALKTPVGLLVITFIFLLSSQDRRRK